MSNLERTPASDTRPDFTRNIWLAAAGLCVLTLLAFWPSLKNGFIWDDDLLLTENALIKAPDGLRYIWASTAPIDYFPITYTSFWLEWRLWGMEAGGYHLTNVLLHSINAMLLWRVFLRLKIPGAWIGAALFAVHPVNVATVAWIAERKNTMAMLFFLLSALFYLRSEDERENQRSPLLCYWLALVMFALSLLSKTAGVMLPVIFLGLAWWRRGLRLADLRQTFPFFGVAFIAGLVTIWFQYHRALELDFPHQPFATRIALAGRAIWFYFYKALLPINLAPVYPEWKVTSVAAYIPGALAVALFSTLFYQQKRWGRMPLFILGGFTLALLPVIGILEVNYEQFSWVADHWQYFSLPFITGLAGALLVHPKIRICLPIGLIAICAVLTWRQSMVYNYEGMWRDTIRKNPTSWVAYNNLGQTMVERGNLEEALSDFQLALKYRPGFRLATLGLASTLLRLNRLPEAIEPLNEILRSHPRDIHNRFNLGSVYLETGQPQLAVEQYKAALSLEPEKSPARSARIPTEEEKTEDNDFRASIYRQLGLAQIKTGQRDEAIASFASSLKLQPNAAETHYHLATLLGLKNDRTGAQQHLREAVRLKPDALEALNNLAWSLATDARATDAEKQEGWQLASHAAELTGYKNAGVLDTLAAACAQTGRFDDAIKISGQAENLANARGDHELVKELESREKLYRQQTAYHE